MESVPSLTITARTELHRKIIMLQGCSLKASSFSQVQYFVTCARNLLEPMVSTQLGYHAKFTRSYVLCYLRRQSSRESSFLIAYTLKIATSEQVKLDRECSFDKPPYVGIKEMTQSIRDQLNFTCSWVLNLRLWRQ